MSKHRLDCEVGDTIKYINGLNEVKLGIVNTCLMYKNEIISVEISYRIPANNCIHCEWIVDRKVIGVAKPITYLDELNEI